MEQTSPLTLLLLATAVACSFAGYSFPGEAEEHTSDRFREMNRPMLIDETNYLVNVAGREYAQCSQADPRNRKSGLIQVRETTEDDRPISGLVDVVDAPHNDSASLTGYIDEALSRWVHSEPFTSTIRKHNRYGCSIQPNCNGKAVIACLFTTL